MIGERIKQLREANSLTQEELAKRLETSKQTIYKYENQIITNIPSDKIEILAKIFKVSPIYLMGWDETNEESPPKKKGIKIPVLGRVAAGVPIEMIEDVLDYEEITDYKKLYEYIQRIWQGMTNTLPLRYKAIV